MDRGADWVNDAPLFAAWRRFVTADVAPFTIPGHKRRGASLHPDLGRLLDADVPLYGGADTVKLTAGVLAEAERRAAVLWGADTCRFSTGGATHANQVACLAVGRPGATVLVARNAHRSIVGGLVLAGLRPVWLPVALDPRTGAPLGVAVPELRAALARHPDAVAVLCTEPSYQGTVGDLAGLVEAAHAADLPVVVDQAWGAHFGFAACVPPHALQLGADLVVTSAHKMLPSFSPGALLSARAGRIDLDRFERAFETTHTTSPSAAVLASIDASRALLAGPAGRRAIERAAGLAAATRARLADAGIETDDPGSHPPGRYDPVKLVLRFGRAGRSGLDAERALAERGVPVEMADRDTLVAQVGLTDDESTTARLVEGVLASLAGPAGPARPVVALVAGEPVVRMTPRDAFFAPWEAVPRRAALGRVSAELVAPYPPGIPALVPGEVVTAEALDLVAAARAAGSRIAYAADPELATIHVVVERSAP